MANSDLVLVTGASGFIAKHVIKQALEKGYRVRGTLRRPDVEAEVREAVGEQGDRLTFATADLLSDTGWAEAVAGCRYAMHIASVFPLRPPKDRNALVPVARDGTLRVLGAAAAAGVERTVLTSSCVSIWSGHQPDPGRVFTEEDWSLVDSPRTDSYGLSKTLAERAAWDFMANGGRGMTLAVINPSFVLGPVLDRDMEASGQFILMFLRGKNPLVPDWGIEIVDVRDVAACHIAAMERPAAAGRRFIASGGPMRLKEIGDLLGNEFPELRGRMPKAVLPDFLARVAALFDPRIRLIADELGPVKRASNAAAKAMLGVDFHSPEEAAVATARSLIEHKMV